MTRLQLERNADPADVARVREGLLAYNIERIGDPNEEPVHVFLRDSADQVVGGLLGRIRWRWLYVDKLWIADEYRGGGHGTALMAAAEAYARERGCIGAYLDTFEYQARPFYEKLGYSLVGTLDGYPPGYRQFFLSKSL